MVSSRSSLCNVVWYPRASVRSQVKAADRPSRTAIVQKPRPLSTRERMRRRDGIWLGVVIVGLGAAALFTGVSSWRASLAAAISPSDLSPRIVTVTVKPGDSLWSYAKRYGSPANYILDNVDEIATDNKIAADASLIPGQHLQIRVENTAAPSN
jgi:hypothetical protein